LNATLAIKKQRPGWRPRRPVNFAGPAAGRRQCSLVHSFDKKYHSLKFERAKKRPIRQLIERKRTQKAERIEMVSRIVKPTVTKSVRAKAVARRRRRSVIVAALFSSFAIGLGHLYAGRLRRGLAFAGVFYGAVFLGALLRAWPAFRGFVGLLIALFVIYAGAIVDAAAQSRRRREAPLEKYQRWYFYLAAAIVLSLLQNLIFGAREKLLGFEGLPVTSGAMSPTLEFGDQVLIDTWRYRRAAPQKGDVIASRRLIDDRVSFHRVIGVGGESVRIDRGKIYLNDEAFDTKSTPLPEYINIPRIVIPQNEIFALGGNDEFAPFSLLNIDRVIGRATYVWMSQDRARIGSQVVIKRGP
jgi:signal peptidase I